MNTEHKARQYSDQMQCHVCGKAWDVNDPDPPECLTKQEKAHAECEKLRGLLK
jgi:hypothetical protein